MQRFIAILSSILLIAVAASADARGRGGQGGIGGKGYGAYGGVDQQAQFQKKLNLSQEQISQMQTLRQNGGSREEIHSVLTDQQRAMVNEHRSNMSGQRGREGKRRQGRGDPAFRASQAPADANGGG